MKTNEALWASISIMVGTVVAVLAMVRGPWQDWLLLGIVVVWALWLTITFFLPQMRRKQRQQRLQRQVVYPQADPYVEETLVRHVNHRISAYLQAAFPKVQWEWETKDPVGIILYGGRGRIRIHGVENYNYAEVELDRSANLHCSLIQVDPMPGPVASKQNAGGHAAAQPLDPQVWYEIQGREVLENICADLQSRGYHQLTIHEDGSVQTNGQGERVVTAFPTFPEKVYWPPLVRVLEREGYAADAEDNCITVTW